jgi:RNA polymerase sigma factor (sigma-70 family)
MPTTGPSLALDYATLDDGTLVALVKSADRGAFREVTVRCNQRLFRAARGVLNDDAEAEDVVQAAYVDAYARIGDFRGDAALLTWLTRIVLNEAYGRLRARHATVDVEQLDVAQGEGGGQVLAFTARGGGEDPAAAAARAQIRRLLEAAVDALPEPSCARSRAAASRRPRRCSTSGPKP